MLPEPPRQVYEEQDLRSLFDAAPDATLLVDTDGRIERVNSQTESLFGYHRDELLGQPVEMLVPQRFRDAHLDHRRAFTAKPRLRAMGGSLELYACRKDGTEFPIDVMLSPIDLRGRMVISASIRDISEQKNAAAKLAEAFDTLQLEKEFSESLVTTLQGIVLNLDAEGKITLVNPYFEDLTGYDADEVVGLDWFDTFIPEDDRPTIREVFSTVMAEGINSGYINPIVTKKGDLRTIQWYSKTIKDKNGSFVGLLNTGFDVTEKEADAMALREAKEEADRATAIKTRFLAAASHDLRQPLQSIGLYLAILARQLRETKAQEIAGKMRQSLDSMGAILDALLDISKLDSGSVVPEIVDFPLQQLLDQLIADNQPLAEAKGLALIVEPTPLIVRSDPALLQRIIDNFVANALRYTESGSVKIACSGANENALIAVTDTGVGIPEDALETIFEEYIQLDNPIRDRSKGLGLGLAIVRHLARLLGHELDVQSTWGKGSTFSVHVPLRGVASVTDTASVVSHEQAGTIGVATVLVVDDDPAVADATGMLLEVEGYHVQTARDGNEAFSKIQGGLRPDMIISDYRLPGMNGVEVVRHIRDLAGNDVPSILVTGDTSLNEIVAAGLPSCAVLHKPINSEHLISLIRESCGLPAGPG